VQEKGRNKVLLDYHLRVGQLTRDTAPPDGYQLREQRLDETETGKGTTVSLIAATKPAEWVAAASPEQVAEYLGLDAATDGLLEWDVFDAVLSPGDVIALMSWRGEAAADAFADNASLPEGARLRQVRIVRDYSMFDRHEAPQYYPNASRN
jgi:hypothetical protein